MRRILAIISLAILMLAVPEQALTADAKGTWGGTLEVNPSARLRLIVRIRANDAGALVGSMDSIDQGAAGIPLADIAATDTSLTFNVPAVQGRYEGKWDEAQKGWAGQWTQGTSWPLLLTVASPTTPPPPPPQPLPTNWSIPADPAIGTLIEQRITGRIGAGIAIGVVDAGKRRLVVRGPVDGAAFDGDTLFEIGSISKTFTGLILADMVVRGEVALDDPAEKYMPAGAKLPERGGRKITLLDLVTHRSGLPRLADNMPMADPLNPYVDFDEARMLEFLGRHQLRRDIGSQYEYSNLGVGLLGYLLARRAGTSYEKLLAKRITGPLGMRNTVISLSPAQKRRFAPGYDGFMRPTKAWDIPTLAGAGAIRSNVKDLLIYLEALIGARQTPLSAAMRLMLEKRWPGPNARTETGISWMVQQMPTGTIVWHNGGTGGYRSILAFDPAKRRGAIILTNTAANPQPDSFAMHLLLGAPLAPMVPVPTPPAAAPAAR